MALQERDMQELREMAASIHGRSMRVCHVVAAEVDNYELCVYTKRVMDAVRILRDQVMDKFVQRVDEVATARPGNCNRDVYENEFIDASRMVYDAVREIRRTVLMNRVNRYKANDLCILSYAD